MRLAKEWNNSDSQDMDRKLGMQNEKIYVLGDEEHVDTGDVSRNESRADFQARVQGLYGQTNESGNESGADFQARVQGLYGQTNESGNESGADFLARVQGLYGQTNESNEENNLLVLPNTCNQPGPTLVVTEPRVQNKIAYRFEKFISMVDIGVSSRSYISN